MNKYKIIERDLKDFGKLLNKEQIKEVIQNYEKELNIKLNEQQISKIIDETLNQ